MFRYLYSFGCDEEKEEEAVKGVLTAYIGLLRLNIDIYCVIHQ